MAEFVKDGRLIATSVAPSLVAAIAAITTEEEMAEVYRAVAFLDRPGLWRKTNAEYNAVLEVRLRADHQVVQFLGPLRKGGGDRRSPSRAATVDRDNPRWITRSQAHRARLLAAFPWELIKAEIDEYNRRGERASREGIVWKLSRAGAWLTGEAAHPLGVLGRNRFGAIVVDPAWRYGSRPPPYKTQDLDEIRDRCKDIPHVAAAWSHIYLWVTNYRPVLDWGLCLLREWGFKPSERLIAWVKPGLGLGSGFREAMEFIMFAVRGNLPLRRHDQPDWFDWPEPPFQWFEGPRGAHSEKPQEFYDLVRQCSPGPYLDVFARKQREGWEVWGNEVHVPAPEPAAV
jgi:N6-adenosine-specific RNA methylase IME4